MKNWIYLLLLMLFVGVYASTLRGFAILETPYHGPLSPDSIEIPIGESTDTSSHP